MEGIGKLIELLDLYRRENKTEELFGEPGTLVPLTGKDFIMLNRVMIISKEYGFIKRLVDNDKIDFESENYPLKKYYPYFSDDILAIVGQDCNTYEDRCKVCYDEYESLLMLLAIQDEPIEFLISILK